jgi:hypothetical protein
MTYSIYTRNTEASGDINNMLTNMGLDPVLNLRRRLSIDEMDSTVLGVLDISRRNTNFSLSVDLVATLDYDTINTVSGIFKSFIFEDVFEDKTPVTMYAKVTEPLLYDSYEDLDYTFTFHIEGDDLVMNISIILPQFVPPTLGNGEIEVYVVTIPQ